MNRRASESYIQAVQPSSASARDKASLLIIAGCILFNLGLCYINTHVTAISPPHIIACEIILLSASVALGFFSVDKAKLYWVAFFAFQLTLILVLSSAKGELLAKPARDMAIMPIFTVLGLVSVRANVTKFLLILGALIVAFAFYEAFFVSQFIQNFNVAQYYINKGAMEELEYMQLDLFASGVRPNQRYLLDIIPGMHRISSVFLEPISLGYFAMIAGLYFVAMRGSMSGKAFLFGLIISYTLIWLSDARLAFGMLSLCLITSPLLAKLDHRLSIFIFISAFLFALFLNVNGLLVDGDEGLVSRLHLTFSVLSKIDSLALLGLGDLGGTEDTAMGKIIENQGLLGFLLYWLAPIFFLKNCRPESSIYIISISIFIAFGFLLSSGIFTIKTAALMWFLYGYIIAFTFNDDVKENAAMQKRR